MNRFACILIGLIISCGGSPTPSSESPAPIDSADSAESGQSGMQAGDDGKHSEDHRHEDHRHDDHSHDFSPALNAFHETLKPLWHAKGDTRAAGACAGVENLKQKANGVIVAPVPEKARADADGWKAAAAGLASSLTHLESQCAKGLQASGFDDSFKAVHDAFHVLVEKLGDKK